MRVAVEIVFDDETKQWCVGMMAPPWIASCGSTRTEAKRMFAEALQAYLEAPRIAAKGGSRGKGRVERIRVA